MECKWEGIFHSFKLLLCSERRKHKFQHQPYWNILHVFLAIRYAQQRESKIAQFYCFVLSEETISSGHIPANANYASRLGWKLLRTAQVTVGCYCKTWNPGSYYSIRKLLRNTETYLTIFQIYSLPYSHI